jgi:hypothetical protein
LITNASVELVLNIIATYNGCLCSSSTPNQLPLNSIQLQLNFHSIPESKSHAGPNPCSMLIPTQRTPTSTQATDLQWLALPVTQHPLLGGEVQITPGWPSPSHAPARRTRPLHCSRPIAVQLPRRLLQLIADGPSTALGCASSRCTAVLMPFFISQML